MSKGVRFAVSETTGVVELKTPDGDFKEAEPPPCDVQSVPMARLAEALFAERSAIMEVMERRHNKLLSDLAAQPKSSGAQIAETSRGFVSVNEVAWREVPCSDEPTSQEEPCIDQLTSQEVADFQPKNVGSNDSVTPSRESTSFTHSASTNKEVVRGLRAPATEEELMALELATAKGSRYVYLRVRMLVLGYPLEVVLAVLILMNACTIAIQAQYNSFDVAFDLNIQGVWPDRNSRSKDTWPGADTFLFVTELFFGVVFTLEVVLKFGVAPKRFVLSAWNWFDTVIVGFWFMSTVTDSMISNPMLLRLLRIVKLLRLMRLVKSIQLFDVLHLLIGSLQASWNVFLWSTTLLFGIVIVGALVLNFLVEDFIKDVHNSPKARKEVFERFGSFARSLLTMFEMTLGNWVPSIRLLQEEVSEWYGPVFLIYLCIVNFAVVTIIRAVFMHETFKVAASDDDLMILQKDRQVTRHIQNMDRFFKEADVSGDGYLSYDEFADVTRDPRVKSWLSAMDFDASNAKQVFELLDEDGSLRLSAVEVVTGVGRLKGGARSIDMISLMRRCEGIEHTCQQMEKYLIGIASGSGVAIDKSPTPLRRSYMRKSLATPSAFR